MRLLSMLRCGAGYVRLRLFLRLSSWKDCSNMFSIQCLKEWRGSICSLIFINSNLANGSQAIYNKSLPFSTEKLQFSHLSLSEWTLLLNSQGKSGLNDIKPRKAQLNSCFNLFYRIQNLDQQMQQDEIQLKEMGSPLIDKSAMHPMVQVGVGTVSMVQVGVGTDAIALSDKPDETVKGGGSSVGEDMAEVNDNINRPSIKGPYRPIRNGTIQGSISALVTSAIATGILNLPVRVHQLGVIPFTIVMTLIVALSYYGMVIMEWIIVKHKVQSYAEMVNRAFGRKKMLFSEYLLIFLTWGGVVCTEVVFIRFANQLLNDVIGLPLYQNRDLEIYSTLGAIFRVLLGLAMALGNIKYLMMTDLGEMLGTVGRMSIIGITFCMVVIGLTALFGFDRDYKDSQLDYDSIFTMSYQNVEWKKPLNIDYFHIFLQAAASMYFTIVNPQFVFPLISHLKKPTRRRVDYIFRWAHYEELFITLAMGLLGYLLLAQHQDILPISQLVISSIPTWPLLVGKFMVVFALFVRLPLMLFTTKEFIYQSLDIPRCQQTYKKMNIWLVGSSLAVALLFENVNMYFSFLGGTLGVAAAAVIPLACAFKLLTLSNTQRYISWFVIAMSILVFLGAIQSVIFKN